MVLRLNCIITHKFIMNGYFSFIISSELTDYHHSNIEHVCFKFSSTDRGAVIHSVRHNKFTLLSRISKTVDNARLLCLAMKQVEICRSNEGRFLYFAVSF